MAACTIQAEGSLDLNSLENSGGSTIQGVAGKGGDAGAAGGSGVGGGASGVSGAAQGGSSSGASGASGVGGFAGDAGANPGGNGGAGNAGGDGGASGAVSACSKSEDCGEPGPCVKYECSSGVCSKILFGKGISCDNDLDKCNGTCACDGNGTAVTTPAANTDDGDVCTNDVCEPTTGTIAHIPIDGCANCTTVDQCPKAGSCTKVECSGGKCQVTPLPQESSCDDGDQCNGQELCDGKGQCVPGTPSPVDDNNACTEDLCDKNSGIISHFDVNCGLPSCDFFNGKAVAVSCDPAKGCIKTDVACQNGFSCDGNSPVCASSCSAGENLVCLPGLTCRTNGQGCALPNTKACSSHDQCASGHCEVNTKGQKICSSIGCGGCALINDAGTACVNVPGGQDPKGACNDKSYGCASKDNCDGNGACQKKAEGESCGVINGRKCKDGECCDELKIVCD